MNDSMIVELYWARDEGAIEKTAEKYGGYCSAISINILGNNEDANECVNDTYLRAWNSMPEQRPDNLRTFLGKITRNLSFNRYRDRNAQKRGGETALALSELEECIPGGSSIEKDMDSLIITSALNRFLDGLSDEHRRVFVHRYWHLSPIREIAKRFNMSESKVKSMLMRLRERLRNDLEKEGIFL